MPIATYNLSWITLNVFLAFVPVVFTILLRRRMHIVVKWFLLLLWFFFLPNTIYLITDLQWMPGQLLATEMPEQAVLFAQYIILTFLGIFTYFFSLEPIGRQVAKKKMKGLSKNMLYIILNCILAFAVVLGKVQRTHSIYLFLDIKRVIDDVLATLTSPILMMWVVVISIVINGIFFLCRKRFENLLGEK